MGEAKRRARVSFENTAPECAELYTVVAFLPTNPPAPLPVTALIYTSEPYRDLTNWRRPLPELVGERGEREMMHAFQVATRLYMQEPPGPRRFDGPPADTNPLALLNYEELYDWSKTHVTFAIKTGSTHHDEVKTSVVRGARLMRAADDYTLADELARHASAARAEGKGGPFHVELPGGLPLEITTPEDWTGDRRRYVGPETLIEMQIGAREVGLTRHYASAAAQSYVTFCKNSVVHPDTVVLLAVTGYAKDQREVWDIPETRQHYRWFAEEMGELDPRGAWLSRLHDTSKEVLFRCGVTSVRDRDRWWS